jgi:hypothetical protein
MHEIVRTNSNNADFQHLVKLLDYELWQRYEEAQAQYDKHNKIKKMKLWYWFIRELFL